MNTETPVVKVIQFFLGAALLISLVGAGWNVYRRLPAEGAVTRTEISDANANSVVTIFLRSETAPAQASTRIELYPIDFAAAQTDYSAVLRPGKSFDDFLAQRMKGLVPVRAQTDDTGRAVAKLSEGNWWIRATAALNNGEKIEWRMPIKVSGSAQTIELTSENAYERTKRF
jgi:hypothetical protein